MAFDVDVVVEGMAKEIQDYMKEIIKKEVYDAPASEHYARTGDLLNSVQFKVTPMKDSYRIQVGFDKSLIRPRVSSNPYMYNQHMTGRGNAKHPRDVSGKLPEWYDKGFTRHGKHIQTNIVNRTKEAFPVKDLEDRLATAILSQLKLK